MTDKVYTTPKSPKIHTDGACGQLHTAKTIIERDLSDVPMVWREWCLDCSEHLSEADRKSRKGPQADPPDTQPKHPVVGMDLYQWRTEDFKLKHGLDESDLNIQFEKLKEEVRELKGALLFGQGDVAEELADVIFVCHLLAHMEGIDVREAFDEVSDENLQKSVERDADGFITKD